MARRKMFDRPQHKDITHGTNNTLRDPEPIASGYKRIYTVVSAMYAPQAGGYIRFGTGGEDNPKWHEQEPAPAYRVYYHTEREYHCRQQDRGLVEFVNCSGGTAITVNWHGYDIKYEEQG